MFEDKKAIYAGDGSTNIQGKNVTVTNNGLSYSEVKEVAMDVFKSNFYDLGEKVKSLVNERAEELINQYLERLEKEAPESINNTDDPDVRFAIYEAQKSYARLGDREISDLLVDLLLQRTVSHDESFKKIVLNEALTIIPKLTTKQIDTLSLIYIIRYLLYKPEFKVPFEAFSSVLLPFVTKIDIPQNEMLYQHLQYSGCISISIGSASFDSIIIHKFPHLFSENQDVISVLNPNPILINLRNSWDNSKLCSCTLTSVGIAIALSNLKLKMGYNWDIGLWINDNS